MPRTSTKSRSRSTKSRRLRPKSKLFTLKNSIVAIVVAFVAIGGAAAFALSQMNQDTRSAAYLAGATCTELSTSEGACKSVPGCKWIQTVYKCSAFEPNACPTECIHTEGKCSIGPSYCVSFSKENCGDDCSWQEEKCEGTFTRPGAGYCTGTANTPGGGGGGSNPNPPAPNPGGGGSNPNPPAPNPGGGGSNPNPPAPNPGGGGGSGGGSVNQPKGFFDAVSADYSVRGWACDPDNYGQALKIHFYVDNGPGKGTFIGETIANVQREKAVGNECGGRSKSGFSFKIPDQYVNTGVAKDRKIYAYAIDIGAGSNANTNKHLSKSPLTYKTKATVINEGVGVIRARGTLAGGAYPVMEVRIKNKKWTSWSVTNSFKDYTFELPANTKVSDLTVHFTNDFYAPDVGQDRNLEVDYLKIGNSIYQSEAASTFSDGTWANGSCSPGNKKSQWLHCRGYFKYAQ